MNFSQPFRDDALERLGPLLADVLAAEAHPASAQVVRAAVERAAEALARGSTWVEIGDLDAEALAASGLCGSRPEDGKPIVLEPAGFGFQRCVADEVAIVENLRRLQSGVAPLPGWTAADADSRVARLAAEVAGDRPEVARSVEVALRRGVTLVTGGPGSGKTSAVVRIVAAIVKAELEGGGRCPRVALAAPTGIAAKRLREAFVFGLDVLRQALSDEVGTILRAAAEAARTVHRLLGVSRDGLRVHHDQIRPLREDVVVVDEASMIDLHLLARLTAAVRTGARLILLGDAEQLPAVGAGSCFRDLLEAAEYAGSLLRGSVARFLGIHRFGRTEDLVRLCEAVRTGRVAASMDVLRSGGLQVTFRPMRRDDDFYGPLASAVLDAWQGLENADPADALERLRALRILVPHHGGPRGRRALNTQIREILFPGRGGALGPGDVVLVTSNDPETGLSNGDLGVVLESRDGLWVWFAGVDGPRSFTPGRLPPWLTGFATTVHKAQGAEFERVIFVLPEEDDRLLTRELLFTAVSRARQRFELWGSLDVWTSAMARRVPRATGLTWRLGG